MDVLSDIFEYAKVATGFVGAASELYGHAKVAYENIGAQPGDKYVESNRKFREDAKRYAEQREHGLHGKFSVTSTEQWLGPSILDKHRERTAEHNHWVEELGHRHLGHRKSEASGRTVRRGYEGGMPYYGKRRLLHGGYGRGTRGRITRRRTTRGAASVRSRARRPTGRYIGRKRTSQTTAHKLVAAVNSRRQMPRSANSTRFSRAVAANAIADAIAPASGSTGPSAGSSGGGAATSYYHDDAAVGIKRALGISGTFFCGGQANNFKQDQTPLLSIYAPTDIDYVSTNGSQGDILYTKGAKTTITLTNMDVLACDAEISFWESHDNVIPATQWVAHCAGSSGAASLTANSTPLLALQYGLYISGQATDNKTDAIDARGFSELDSPTFCHYFHRYSHKRFMMVPGVDYTFEISDHRTHEWDFSKMGNVTTQTEFMCMKHQKFMTAIFQGGTVTSASGGISVGDDNIGSSNVDSGQVRVAGIVHKSMSYFHVEDDNVSSIYRSTNISTVTTATGISLAGGGVVADTAAGG